MIDEVVVVADPSGDPSRWGTLRVSPDAADDLVAALAASGVRVDPDETVELTPNELVAIALTVAQWTMPAVLVFFAGRTSAKSVKIRFGDEEIELKGPVANLDEAAKKLDELRATRIEQLKHQRELEGEGENQPAVGGQASSPEQP